MSENSTAAINFEVTDPDSILTVANFSATSADSAIVPNTAVNLSLTSPTIPSGETNTVTLTVTPKADAYGDVTLFFIASDQYHTVTNALNLTVRPVGNMVLRPTAGLLGWWPGDGNANDVFGVNDEQLNGNADFDVGLLGQAFAFHGYNDYLQLPNLPATFSPYSFTAEAWVYPNSNPQREMSLTSCGQETSPYQLKLDLVKRVTDDFFLRLSLHNGVTNGGAPPFVTNLVPFLLEGSAPIPLERWTHIAMTLDPWAGFSLYVNGVLDATGKQGPFGLSLYGTTDPWLVGGCGDLPFFGRTDEFSFYGRTLSQNEVRDIYESSRNGTPLPPQIISPPQSVNAGIGADAAFTVLAGSPGGLSLYYQWQFLGQDLPGETNATLVLHQVQPEQSGPYTVIVSNAIGSVTGR